MNILNWLENKIDTVWEPKRVRIEKYLNATKLFNEKMLKIYGGILLIVFYVVLVYAKRLDAKPQEWAAFFDWFTAGAAVGIIELMLIFIFNTTLTAWIRKLCKRKVDIILMLSLIPFTWWLAGPFAAGFHFTGLLSSHFFEKQPKD